MQAGCARISMLFWLVMALSAITQMALFACLNMDSLLAEEVFLSFVLKKSKIFLSYTCTFMSFHVGFCIYYSNKVPQTDLCVQVKEYFCV